MLIVHVITGEGNSEDAVIILQQQQGEGWAEVIFLLDHNASVLYQLWSPGGPNGDDAKVSEERAAKGNEPDCSVSHLQWTCCCTSGVPVFLI